MIIVIDTNIIFSGIVSPKGKISDILLNSSDNFEFFAPTFILEELEKHHEKLRNISKLSEKDLLFLKRMILKRIELIDLENIRVVTWKKAIELTKDIDEYDAPFIALSLELEVPFWTGDKKLLNGLRKKGINWILNTEKITELRNENN